MQAKTSTSVPASCTAKLKCLIFFGETFETLTWIQGKRAKTCNTGAQTGGFR